MEIWRDLKGHEQYSVSSRGRIKNKKTGRVYVGSVNNHGYVRFDLCENGKRFVVAAHRAVAETFLQPSPGRGYVNHKDGDKTNNSIDNLEWCTPKENSVHAYTILGRQAHNKKAVKCIETGVVYESAMEAERKTGIKNGCINRCCTGQRKSTNGLKWEYAALV